MLKSIIHTKFLNNSKFLTSKRLASKTFERYKQVSSAFNVQKVKMSEKIQYPKAKRDESCIDVYHGVKIPDPYRWLEDPDAEETKAYVDSQNAITVPFLKKCEKRQFIYDRLKELWNFAKYSCPARHGDKYYFYKNTGLQNQSVLYVQDTLDSEPKVFLDPNLLSKDGTIAITNTEFTEDGSIFAYALSESGSDWENINFINTKTGEKYTEVLRKVKYSTISWTHDNVGIFYGCYPHANEGADGSETSLSQNQKLMFHKIGTPQSEDVIVVDFPENPLWRIDAKVSDCGNWLIVLPQQECSNNLVYFTKLGTGKSITSKLPLTQIIKVFEADYEYVTNSGTKAVFKTNKNSPNCKLVSIDLENFKEDNWIELVPEHSHNVLDWAHVVDKDKLILCYIEDVKSVLAVHTLENGKYLKNIPLEIGTVVELSGDKKYSEIFYQIKSFLTPGIIYTLDFKNTDQTPKVFREVKINNFDPSNYKTTQIFYESKDGTKIPMFVVHRKDAPLDGSMPALLYGYGGFNISLQPVCSVTRLAFIQHFDGVLAIPNIRGGGEYGEKWHKGGCIFKKQNSLDDFISAAEYLIKNGYTSKEKLTIMGGSNGGFLVAACANQRPDLFGAVICQVGVLDMLKFHKYTVGYAWVSDYGCSDDPKQFENILKLSPLHNIKVPENGGQYPAMFLLTADHDDRVVPLHSLKHIATLQHTLGNLPQQKNPLIIKVDVKAGHGMGKPTLKVIEEHADTLTFIMQTLNLNIKI